MKKFKVTYTHNEHYYRTIVPESELIDNNAFVRCYHGLCEVISARPTKKIGYSPVRKFRTTKR